MQPKKVDLSKFNELAHWTQRWYHRSIRYSITEKDGMFTCLLDFCTWEKASGTGANPAAAKAAAAENAWKMIYEGSFIGDSIDIAAYESTTGETIEYDY